mgnify:CR=1 FL=1
MKYVIDSGVFALFFAGSMSVKKYFNEIFKGLAKGYTLELNIAEFMYNYAKKFGWETAKARASLIRNSRIAVLTLDENLTEKAAKFKLKYRNLLSLVDCYTAALAEVVKGTILTTDENLASIKEVKAVLFKV